MVCTRAITNQNVKKENVMSFPISPFPEQYYVSYGGGDEGKEPIFMENFVGNTTIRTEDQNICYITGYYVNCDGEPQNVTGYIKAILDEDEIPQLRYGFNFDKTVGNPSPSIIPKQSFSYSIEDTGSTLTADVILGSFRMATVFERGFFLNFNVAKRELSINVSSAFYEGNAVLFFFDGPHDEKEDKIKEMESKGYRF